MKTLRKFGLRLASWFLSDQRQDALLNFFSRRLRLQVFGEITDEFLETLLGAMDVALALCRGFRKNTEGFGAVYAFRTRDEKVAVTAVFRNGRMRVEERLRPDYDARVTFRDAKSLWSFLLSENQDILNCILDNSVEVEGNLTYIYRFGFLAKDLIRRLDALHLVQA